MTFSAFAQSHGLVIGDVYPSERIMRCGTDDKPRSTNGAYFFNGQRGFIFRWDAEAKPIWWNDANVTPWTDAEKREWSAKKRAAEQSREDGYRRAGVAAQKIIAACKPETHNYLRNKKLPDALGLVNVEHELIVPMRHVTNNDLVGCQTIKWLTDSREWQKKMTYEMRAKGAVFRLGSKHATETFLVEGYATGLTLELALRRLNLNAAVLICFSANNLTHVAPLVHGAKFAFADNDKSGTGEAAAKAAGIAYCMSPVEGFDANDHFQKFGLLPLCQLILTLRAK